MYNKLVIGGAGQIPIMLWKQPGLPVKEENFTGALSHGYEVDVIRKKEYDSEPWFYVRADVKHEGGVYLQKGWVKKSLLKEIGIDDNNDRINNKS